MSLKKLGGNHLSSGYRKTIASLVRIKRVLKDTEIGAEFNILHFIAHRGKDIHISPTLIAKHFHMTTPMVAKTLRILAAKKYITVTPDPKDGRKVHLKLTDAGKKNLRQKIKAIRQWYISIFNKLSKKDINEFVRLSNKVVDIAFSNLKGIRNV